MSSWVFWGGLVCFFFKFWVYKTRLRKGHTLEMFCRKNWQGLGTAPHSQAREGSDDIWRKENGGVKYNK